MTRRPVPPRVRWAAILAAIGLVLSGCADDAGSGDRDAATGTTAGAVTVHDVWARATVAAARTGAVFAELEAPTGDTLVDVEVDAAVAAGAVVHETVVETVGTVSGAAGGDHGDHTAEEIVSMAPLERLTLPAGDPVHLEPGGIHVMLTDLAAPLTEGTTIELTLVFERAGRQVVTAEVRADAP